MELVTERVEQMKKVTPFPLQLNETSRVFCGQFESVLSHIHYISYLLQLEGSTDITQIMFWLRSGFMRNLGGIADPRLFAVLRTGTKKIMQVNLSK